MPTLNLTSYSRPELEHVLKMLKSYRNGLKQIGKRAQIIDPLDPPRVRARVEYSPAILETDILRYAQACIRQLFPGYEGDVPNLIKNEKLKGGARVFVGDDMVDISFQKFESLLK